MDILFSIVTGLGLRFICLNLTEPHSKLSPIIIGVWEGAISHLVLSQDPELQQLNFDHFLAYGLRLVFDLILTQDPARPLAVVLWTGVSLWLCQFIDQQPIPQQSKRRKRSRRHRASATSSLPSHVRVYQTPQPPQPQTIPPDPLTHAATPPHEQPSTPPSFFLQGEGSEAIHLSPALDQPSSALVDLLRPPSALAPQLEADDGKAQDKPAPFPTPPATFASPEVDKDLTSSAKRLSTIVEASSVEDVTIMAMTTLGATNAGAQSALPERKEQDQNVNGVRTTTTRTDTVPLPVPDPFSRQLRSRAPAQTPIVADSESATLISVKPATAHKFLLRPYPEEEVLSDELQTPLNPVARALLEDDVDNVFTDNELEDELRTPLNFARQLVDGPLSPLSPLLSVQVRLSDAQASSSHKPPSGTQIAGTTTDATLARSSLLISSEADELESLESDAESSMLSTAVPTELYAHGDDWRKKAWQEEKKHHELKRQYDEALKELRVKDALMLKGQIAESDATIKKLHEKAARRYYKARNKPGQVQIVDVHGLRVDEALKMTEKALRNALSSGHETLKVITGRGLHSKGKLPVLKYALLRAMEKQKIPCQPDPVNPGVLIVTLPS